MRLSVPGNILLTGEYAVLEQGGQGLAMAVERRFVLEAAPAEQWSFQGVFPDRSQSIAWDQDVFLSGVLTILWKHYPEIPPHALVLDSRDLYQGQRKLGLGSSACTALALTALFYRLHSGSMPQPRDIEVSAIEAHRTGQGGRGSGYDVMTSLYGGAGCFSGGIIPGWEALEVPLSGVWLFSGAAPVSSRAAVERWEEYRNHHASQWQDFLQQAARIAETGRQGLWQECLTAAREWGIALGREIGVDASLRPPAGADPAHSKAVGAGNELGISWQSPADPEDSDMVYLEAAREGLRWE